jgi:hypothetical protein
MTLTELFPDEDYRFHFRFERGNPVEFFGTGEEHESIITQRDRLLVEEPKRHSALLPDGVALLDETIELAREWGTLKSAPFPQAIDSTEAWSNCLGLGRTWEPDFLLLKIEPTRVVRLVAGCVCFPSSWSLEEKIGNPIESIHGVVPDLNDSIGAQIHTFLTKLRPGVAWLRSNWGLSGSADLNQHPARALPRLDANVPIDHVWLRVENQALVALPKTGGVLFGIRIAVHPLSKIRENRPIAARLGRALATMPEKMASYKGLSAAKGRLISFLTASEFA